MEMSINNNQDSTEVKSRESSLPRFGLGRIFATPGALLMLIAMRLSPLRLLARHVRGDWGDLDEHDREQNNLAVLTGQKVFSAYEVERTIDGQVMKQKFWVITEADRASTTVLLPDEY